MAGMKTLIIIFVIMFPVAMITEEDVNHGVCPVPMNKEEEEFIKERERNRELMEEIAREIEMTCLDECKTGLHNCHNDAYCTNTKHSFTCTCKAGYTGDGVNCADINECNTGEHSCDVTSSCYNTIGSFGCACKEGHSKTVEDKCTDVNECATGKHKCNGSSICHNTKGCFLCICLPKYLGVNCTVSVPCPNMGILTGTSGNITSPSYPGNYGYYHNCNWKIMASTGNRIKLVIQDMAIEGGTNCPYDYIEIQNAVIYGSGVLPERLCGSLNSSSTFSSNHETLIVRFVTDGSIIARGFKARFTVIPDGEDM